MLPLSVHRKYELSASLDLELDRYIGTRIRLRRRVLNINQQTLAGHLGVSHQQLQKYESGINRISAARLYAAAAMLDVSVAYFFEGVADHERTTPTVFNTLRRAEPDAMAVAEAFLRIRDRGRRKVVFDFLRCVVEEAAENTAPSGTSGAG